MVILNLPGLSKGLPVHARKSRRQELGIEALCEGRGAVCHERFKGAGSGGEGGGVSNEQGRVTAGGLIPYQAAVHEPGFRAAGGVGLVVWDSF